jgi:hypothetical protein
MRHQHSQQTAKTLIQRTLQQWVTYTKQPPGWLMVPASQTTVSAGLNELNTLHLWLIKNVKGNADRNQLISIIERLQNMLGSWREGFEARNVTEFTARVFQTALRNVLNTAISFVSALEESEADLTDTQVVNSTKTLLSGPHQQVKRRAEQVDIESYDWQAYRQQLPMAGSRTSANRVNLRMTVLPVLKGIVTAQRLVDIGLIARQLGDYVLLDKQMMLALRTSWWLKETPDHHTKYINEVLSKLRTKFKQEFVVLSDKSITDSECGYTFYWIAPATLLTTLRRDIKTQVQDWSFA